MYILISTQSQQGFVEHTEIQNCMTSLNHPLMRSFDYLRLCGMGVRAVQGRNGCQILPIWSAKTEFSWIQHKVISTYTIHSSTYKANTCIYSIHTCKYLYIRSTYLYILWSYGTYLIISLNPVLVCAGHRRCCPSLSLRIVEVLQDVLLEDCWYARPKLCFTSCLRPSSRRIQITKSALMTSVTT